MNRRSVRGKILCHSFAWAFAAVMVLAIPVASAAPQNPLAEPATAQEHTSAEPAPQYTLHAYANLVQIPVLVLSPGRDRLAHPVAPNRFLISIDSGPWFRATHVRPEGDDPIALSILLDVHGDATELLFRIPDQLAALAPEYLHPSDHVTVYALDCGLVRSVNQISATPDVLRRGADAALQSWKLRTAAHTRCPQTAHLQEAVLYLVNEMQDLPGRRVILVVSEGGDETGKPAWREVSDAAQNAGTAIFAIAPQTMQVQAYRGVFPSSAQRTNLLNSVCELSGGTLMASTSSMLAGALRDFARMLRERYIVDFPRPAISTPGRHSLEVRIDKTAAFVRPSGISLPIADPTILADPTTVPSDPSLTPVQGTRAVLPH